ncbi:MAG: gliding motility-associated C-terminal domain-containing protein, partial [Bacteroidota bacterium]
DDALISVQLTAVPSITPLNDLSACDSLEFPTITGTDLSGNAAYYDQPNGGGTRLVAGAYVYNSGTYYIYDSNGNCDAEESFAVTINNSVSAGSDNSASVCQGASIDLLTALQGADAGGTFSDDDGSMALSGSVVNTAGLATGSYRFTYSVSGASPCLPSAALITVNVVTAVSAGLDASGDACVGDVLDLFGLLNGADLGGDFSDDDATGALTGGQLTTAGLLPGTYRFTYTVGDGQTCPTDNALITVELIAVPSITPLNDLSACDSLELPAIAGTNLTGNEAYYDQPNGLGNRLSAGSYVYANAILYLYDSNGNCSDETSFDIQIGTSVDAGADNSVSICSGANVSLTTVLSGADPGGVFIDTDGTGGLNGDILNTAGFAIGSYRYTYRVSGTSPCPDDEAIITVNIQNAVDAGADNNGTVCAGQSIDLTSLLVGADPGGTFSDNDNTGNLSGNIFNTTGLAFGSYAFTYTVGNGQNCSNDEALITVTISAGPQINNPGDVSVCDFYVLPPIQGTNLFNAGYFDQSGGNGTALQVGDTIRAFQILYIYGDDGQCPAEETFVVDILETPTVDNLLINCDLASGTYRVSFVVNGGDLASYQVIGNSGVLINATFQSDPIPIGTAYNFQVQDGNLCGIVNLSDNPDCGCISSAGQLSPPSQRLCETSPAVFTHTGANLDSDDQLLFVLHDGDASTIGNILATSPTPEFSFVNGMVYGQPYFVAALVGNPLSGGIDPNDPCLATSDGVELIFDPQIIGSIQGDTSICEGAGSVIVFALEGGNSFDVIIFSNGQNDTLRGIADGYEWPINPGQSTQYNLQSVEVAGSACSAQIPNSLVDVMVNELSVNIQIQSDYNGFDLSCADAEDGAVAALVNGQGSSFSFDWSNGGATAELDELGAGTYELTVTNDIGCTATSSVQLSGPPAIELSLTPQSPFCFGEADGSIRIDDILGGNGPFEYSLDGVQFTSIPDLPFDIPFLEAGIYEVFVQDINDCSVGQQTVVLAPPALVAEIGDVRFVELGEQPRINVNRNFEPSSILWTVQGDILIDCDTCLNPVITPRTSGLLFLQMTDDKGCTVSDTLQIVLDKTRDVFIPNVFSPNNDGYNDFFTIFANEDQVENIVYMSIYNRWGELVFEGRDLTPNSEPEGWDGRFKGELLDPAVFVYYAEVAFIDGVIKVYAGDITLMR